MHKNKTNYYTQNFELEKNEFFMANICLHYSSHVIN